MSTRRGTYTVQYDMPGLTVTEFYDILDIYMEPNMAYDPTPKVQARRRWKRLFGTFLAAIVIALLLSVTEVRATEWKPPENQQNSNVHNKNQNHNNADSTSGASAGSASNSGAAAGAQSGSTSGATSGSSSGSTAVTGPSNSAATSGSTAFGGSGGSVGNLGASGTAYTGPMTLNNNESSSSSTRAFAISLPQPIAGTASASNCLVAGNNGMAIGFNFFSTTKPQAFSDPICTLRAMAAEADQACQFRTAAEMRAEVMAIVLKREPRPVADSVQDLSPEQCMLLKQPRIVMPQASTTYVDASQWQTQDVQPGATVQQQTPPAPPRRRVIPTPAPSPTCAAGETSQCVPQKPGSIIPQR